MKRLWKSLFWMAMLSAWVVAACQPQAIQGEATQPAAQAAATYVGTPKCLSCHSDSYHANWQNTRDLACFPHLLRLT